MVHALITNKNVIFIRKWTTFCFTYNSSELKIPVLECYYLNIAQYTDGYSNWLVCIYSHNFVISHTALHVKLLFFLANWSVPYSWKGQFAPGFVLLCAQLLLHSILDIKQTPVIKCQFTIIFNETFSACTCNVNIVQHNAIGIWGFCLHSKGVAAAMHKIVHFLGLEAPGVLTTPLVEPHYQASMEWNCASLNTVACAHVLHFEIAVRVD